MAAKKKKTTAKKGPAVTLVDRMTGDSASFDDPPAVRKLLINVISRVDRENEIDEADSTDVVADEILRRGGSLDDAIKIVRDAESLHGIFKGTALEDAAKVAPKKADKPITQIPLPKGKDLELTQADISEVVAELWPMFCNRVEAAEGEIAQTIGVTCTWNPPSANRDGYIGVHASMKVQGHKITRTGTVTKKRGGGFQMTLFDTPAE